MAAPNQNSSHKRIESYVPGVRQQNGIYTNLVAVFNEGITINGVANINALFTYGFGGSAITTGLTQAVASAPTVTLNINASIITHTPTQNETINFSAATNFVGLYIALEVITSGVTSYTLTFGTNTKNQGTLATGTVTAKIFLIDFVSDGTNWVEVSRTIAM